MKDAQYVLTHSEGYEATMSDFHSHGVFDLHAHYIIQKKQRETQNVPFCLFVKDAPSDRR